jgi:hypothetical protein
LQKFGFVARIMHEGGAVFLSLFHKTGASKAPLAPQTIFPLRPRKNFSFILHFNFYQTMKTGGVKSRCLYLKYMI